MPLTPTSFTKTRVKGRGPHQPLPAEHIWEDGIGIHSADYVHRAPDIHFCGVLEGADDRSIWWEAQGLGMDKPRQEQAPDEKERQRLGLPGGSGAYTICLFCGMLGGV